ncbi:unnamed protein product, partial [Tetraodon nigroviridis]
QVDDQMKLLQNCWSELLILDHIFRQVVHAKEGSILLVTGQQVDFAVIASQAGATLNNLLSHAQELVSKLRSLQLDQREFVCLKFLVLFSLGLDRVGQKVTKLVGEFTVEMEDDNSSCHTRTEITQRTKRKALWRDMRLAVFSPRRPTCRLRKAERRRSGACEKPGELSPGRKCPRTGQRSAPGYVMCNYPQQTDKFGQLLLRLPEIRAISLQAEEYLYYKHLNGDVPCNNLLIEMLHAKRA